MSKVGLVRSRKMRRSYHYGNYCFDGEEACFYYPSETTLISSDKFSSDSVMGLEFDIEVDDGRKKLQTIVSYINMY